MGYGNPNIGYGMETDDVFGNSQMGSPPLYS
jgi:hypothetical protein